MNVTRGYRWTGARWTHYRAAGTGPLVVLLHGSPQSGAAVAGMQAALVAAGCATLALDNPGNGCSDALPGDPQDVRDYARALAETLDAHGIDRAALYGFHTGAAHAAAFAGLYPERVGALALDGFPIWTAEEQADILAHYLPPFAPSWDGAHVAWAWARMEMQSVFFPWYAHTDAARMPGRTMAAPEVLHEQVLDLLRVGDRYRAPYASAFRCDGAALLAATTAPTLLCCGALDPLVVHLDRVTAPAHVEVRRHGAERAPAWGDIARWLAARATDAPPLRLAADTDSAGETRRMIDGVRVYELPGAGAPMVTMHDVGDSLDAILPRARASGRPVLAVERPLHGDSDGEARPAQAHLARVLDALGWRDAETAIDGGAAPPRFTPTWDGAHLMTAWRYAWRAALFDPWNAPDHQHALSGAPDLAAVHARAVDLLKAWRAPEIASGR